MLQQVAPSVWVAQASLYLTTSTMIVGADGDALVVDPAASTTDLRSLATEVEARGWRVRAGFSTHPHWDHLLWVPELGDVPRWALPAAVDAARHRHAELLAEAVADLGNARAVDAAWFARLTPLAAGADTLPWAPVPIVVRPLSAHAAGSAALLLPDARALVLGDLLSDVEVPLLDLDATDPLADHVAALEEVAALIESGMGDVVIPGHGHVADSVEARRRLTLDRAYLEGLRARRPSADPRLAPGWLLDAHRAQVNALADRRTP